ncbi:Fe(2+) transporter permease subunit FeoB [Legionella septentrionalis]|uniref:Fe(2+) transporter permease subunit FeoB n=1 Tax=Legionella septentrionalis TaxID=2498109 RepID=UPI000F8CC107|nr:Fe(2+) transporter permease subunit FeoB [Legionella septentrionalis]RUR00065.1 Fe(2+) transporter permease subunit FeoB [Legionella septentrionalis]
MTHVVLIGNPNCGKTTVFNALTGDKQRVGNWPGVTVEKKTGVFSCAGQCIAVTDLPGIYSLVCTREGSSQDEQIAAQALLDLNPDILINIIDACHLERHLYLTSQLLELGKPVIVALNMTDIAKQRGIAIDNQLLACQLQCPVVELQAHKQMGMDELKQMVLTHAAPAIPMALALPKTVRQALVMLEESLAQSAYPVAAHYLAHRMLEGDTLIAKKSAFAVGDADVDIVLADARYKAVHQIISIVQKKKTDASDHLTAKIDKVVLHRFWAFPIFFAVMYLMFLFAIHVGGIFQDFFDIATDAIFVQGFASVLQRFHAPGWLLAIGAEGVGKGINTTLTFIPVIASMFFFLSLLESSGYMARAAFVIDKAMRLLGLPGKSFVPMIVGFGCNVPAIMAARTLDSERDRLLTVLMSPFMSCSARLAIYAVFVAAFFPSGGQNVVFSLYLFGIFMAVLTGLLLRKTLLRGQASPLILELPAYHRPSLRRLCQETGLRLRYFILRAGKIIIPACVVLGGLNAWFIPAGEGSSLSILAWLGQCITSIFSPMGLHADNWPATVSLLTGLLAKEVVVGSLNTLYAQMGGLALAPASFDLWGSLQAAFLSIPQNIAALGQAFFHPLAESAAVTQLPQTVYGIMYQQFDGKIGAYAYLLFILLYIPCVSTMAAIRQEATRKLMWFSVAWSLLVAYAAAVSFYQLATCMRHPQQTLIWLAVIFSAIVITVLTLRAVTSGGSHAVTNS